MSRRPFTFVDLFAGLGGFHQAAVKLGGECKFASEIDETLRRIYKENFSIVPVGDIRAVSPEEVPEHDVLCAGFPCQPFSKAGKQLGWKDAVRGTLFSNIIAILETRRPKYVLLENVAHFVRHDSGNTYLKVKAALEALGYEVATKQLSPHQFGIPHIRERMYMVAIHEGLGKFEWPSTSETITSYDISNILDLEPTDAVRLSPRVMECLGVWQEFLSLIPSESKLPSFPIWSMEFGATYPFHRRNLRGYSSAQLGMFRGSFGKDLSGLPRKTQLASLPPYARGEHEVFPKWKQSFIEQNRSFFAEHRRLLRGWIPKVRKFPPSLQKFEWNCQGSERNLWKLIVQFRASGVRVKRPTTSPSLVAMTSTQVPIIPWEKRYMTVSECAKLQSMGGIRHLPNGQAGMAALGNAVNVDVVRRIMEAMLSVA